MPPSATGTLGRSMWQVWECFRRLNSAVSGVYINCIKAAEDRAGILQPGRAADILVVKGNPLIDLNVLWNVNAVYKSGKRVDRH